VLQAFQIERAACLGAGTGQAFTAERLHPDYCADDVAVHIDVADVGMTHDVIYGLVYARV